MIARFLLVLAALLFAAPVEAQTWLNRVQAETAPANNFQRGVDTNGKPIFAQPDATGVLRAAVKVENNAALSALSSAYTTSVARLGFASAGDAPMVMYTPSAAACTLNAGVGDGGSQIPSADGKCWLASFFGNANVGQFGAVGDIVAPIDDSSKINAALSAMRAAGGGIVDLDPSKSYYTGATTIIVPNGVELRCLGSTQNIYQIPFNFTAKKCAIYSAVTGTTPAIRNNGTITGVMVLQDRVRTVGNPSSRAQGLALVAGFTGVGVAIGDGSNPGPANNTQLSNVTIGGFDTCIKTNYSSQDRKSHVFMDCTNGYSLADSHDDDKNDHIEMWQFLTTNRSGYFSSWNIAAIADNGSGAWRITTSTANDLTTGEYVGIRPAAGGGDGVVGRWQVTVVDATHFDLNGSTVSPTTSSTTAAGNTYVNVGSTTGLRRGMSVSGTGIPTGAVIAGVWASRDAISLNVPATATGTPTLTFTSGVYTTNSLAAVVDVNYRSGFGYYVTNSEGVVCSECFVYGAERPFVLNSAVGVSVVNSQIDGSFRMSSATAKGVEFSGYSYNNYLQFATFAAPAYGVYSGGSATLGFPNTVVSNRMYVQGVIAEVGATGADLTILGGGGQDNNSAFLVDQSRSLTISGSSFPAARVFSTTPTPTWYGDARLSQIATSYYPVGRFAGLRIAGAVPIDARFRDNSQGADAKVWRFTNPSSNFALQLLNDNEDTAASVWTCIRSGMTPTQCSFSVPINLPTTPTVGSNSTLAATTAYVDRLRTKVITFTGSGTYTPSAGVVSARVIAFGAGGGGGGGPRVATSTGASGGGGGGGGSRVMGTFSAAQIGASVSVTVGVAGTAGTAAVADSSAGGNGGAGGNTTFGSLLTAFGGGGGAGGAASTASGGGGGAGLSAGGAGSGGAGGGSGFGGTSGGSGVASAATSTESSGSGGGGTSNVGVAAASGAASQSSTGGGGGGGFDASNAAKSGASAGNVLVGGKILTGGVAGVAGGVVAGGAGAAGGSSSGYEQPGSGGGGGAAHATTPGAGGVGGFPGGGGGGGGASQNGALSGAGGAGGAGYAIIIEYF